MNEDLIREAIARDPSRMTVSLARELGIAEVDVVASLPPGRVCELDSSKWEALLHDFQELGNVHVIVTNGAVTLESFGQFGNFSRWGEYFNVQTKTLDMHIRISQLGRIFAVVKPGHLDGVDTCSIQFFDLDGSAAFKVFLTFGGKAPTPVKLAQFDELQKRFRLT